MKGHCGGCSEEVLKDKSHWTSQDGGPCFRAVVGMEANCEGLKMG